VIFVVGDGTRTDKVTFAADDLQEINIWGLNAGFYILFG
jgi:hypothetical protein